MTFRSGSLLGLILVGLLALLFPARGDVGPVDMLTGGGAAAPKSPHPTIRLDSQEVTIRLRPSGYTVDALFNFFNTGATTTEWTGFPKRVEHRGVPHPSATFLRFDAWVDGIPAKFTEERDLSGDVSALSNRLSLGPDKVRGTDGIPKYNGIPKYRGVKEIVSPIGGPIQEDRRWLVRQVTFPSHKSTTIRVSYDALYSTRRRNTWASYIYGTGCLWKGNVGKAIFVIDSTELGGKQKILTRFRTRLEPMPIAEKLNPEPRPLSENVEIYEISDFEPHPEAMLVILRFPRYNTR